MGLLAQKARGTTPIDPRRRCGVRDWIATLDDEDRAEFDSLLEKASNRIDGWNVERVYGACREAGLHVQSCTFRRHVHGTCSCAVLNG